MDKVQDNLEKGGCYMQNVIDAKISIQNKKKCQWYEDMGLKSRQLWRLATWAKITNGNMLLLDQEQQDFFRTICNVILMIKDIILAGIMIHCDIIVTE